MTAFVWGGAPLSVTRTLGTTANSTIELGTFADSATSPGFDIHLATNQSGYVQSKRYYLLPAEDDTGNAWKRVTPDHDSGLSGTNDMALEFKGTTGSWTFRIVRVSGSTSAAVTAMIRPSAATTWGPPSTFTESSATSTSSGVATYVGARLRGFISFATVSVTTGTLANGATETGTVALGLSGMLGYLTADYACWVRLYGTSAARTADASRVQSVDPLAGLGVYADNLPGIAAPLGFPLSPPQFYRNDDTVRVDDLYYSITNLSGGSHAITVDFAVLILES